MRETQLYKEDWIGLRELDERGGVVQIKIPGNHVGRSGDKVWRMHPVTPLANRPCGPYALL